MQLTSLLHVRIMHAGLPGKTGRRLEEEGGVLGRSGTSAPFLTHRAPNGASQTSKTYHPPPRGGGWRAERLSSTIRMRWELMLSTRCPPGAQGARRRRSHPLASTATSRGSRSRPGVSALLPAASSVSSATSSLSVDCSWLSLLPPASASCTLQKPSPLRTRAHHRTSAHHLRFLNIIRARAEDFSVRAPLPSSSMTLLNSSLMPQSICLTQRRSSPSPPSYKTSRTASRPEDDPHEYAIPSLSGLFLLRQVPRYLLHCRIMRVPRRLLLLYVSASPHGRGHSYSPHSPSSPPCDR